MVDTRSGKSTTPYTQAQEEQLAAILEERKEKELLKQAKLKATAEEQAAKKKKLEEEMMRLQKEEEEKRRVAEEEAAEEEEALEGLLRRRTGERGQSSGTKEEDLWMEKKISEWVANVSLGEGEEAMLYVPQEEKGVARELEAIVDPLEKKDWSGSCVWQGRRRGGRPPTGWPRKWREYNRVSKKCEHSKIFRPN
ncbi:hypothetical protein CBR_g11966 [Chara braunii]|uniref:Uncharacterized protein n=1 Tax=Chara braunii TaxID=69332 RepID=A0A388KQW1_CHABU|nr:hypothetical protein CBR_g11966 [Chara braunii]|eukprot:GBG72388.1 hypothetical protein CBR_g11966 [Chara braunii]